MGRFGAPADTAHAVLYLASPTATWITGSELVLDGDYVAAWLTGHSALQSDEPQWMEGLCSRSVRQRGESQPLAGQAIGPPRRRKSGYLTEKPRRSRRCLWHIGRDRLRHPGASDDRIVRIAGACLDRRLSSLIRTRWLSAHRSLFDQANVYRTSGFSRSCVQASRSSRRRILVTAAV
nr:hypothetical protein [Burkholderia diffusa]